MVFYYSKIQHENTHTKVVFTQDANLKSNISESISTAVSKLRLMLLVKIQICIVFQQVERFTLLP